jgi:hypothetical protein
MKDIGKRHELYARIQRLKREMVKSVLKSRGEEDHPIHHSKACSYLEKEYKLNMSETRR